MWGKTGLQRSNAENITVQVIQALPSRVKLKVFRLDYFRTFVLS